MFWFCFSVVQERGGAGPLVGNADGRARAVPRRQHRGRARQVHAARRTRLRSGAVQRRVHTGSGYVQLDSGQITPTNRAASAK